MDTTMVTSALRWIGKADGHLELVDQRRLPGEFTWIECRAVEPLYEAIKTLAVRGAPAIGVAAGYGLVLALHREGLQDAQSALAHLVRQAAYLASARPTAVNLFWALDRVKGRAQALVRDHPLASVDDLRQAVFDEASAIQAEDVQMCLRIGENGSPLISDGSGVVTHCNAGALATSGQGTALSVLFQAHAQGKRFTVYADETRPLLQGSRLTAWELQQAGIEVVVLCDNMAGWLMKQKKVQAVITGADRIAANGDTANKIGTYSLSVLAAKHGIPFYVAAPSSTFDLSMATGANIPIEQRAAEEVAQVAGRWIAPQGVRVYNPAFDVTDASLIAAIITERGVIERPTQQKIAAHFRCG
jgi:methylthioribose-1-phosphate isomerase